MKRFQYQFRPQGKYWEGSYQLREILALFCKLVALILGYNCVEDHRFRKIVKQIKFEGGWGELEARNSFQRQSFTKYYKQSLVFM